jgi:cell division protein FtsW
MNARSEPASSRGLRRARTDSPPLEHRILVTVTLCLLAFGAVMVYSASSPVEAISGTGYGTGEFVTYLIAAAIGLVVMRVLERVGLSFLNERMARLLLLIAFGLLLAVLIPGIGREVQGARRWFAFGPLEFQPSELMKFALIVYLARRLADHPPRENVPFRQAVTPVAVVAVPAMLLIVLEPDLGTTLVVFFVVMSLLMVAGLPGRQLLGVLVLAALVVTVLVVARPYERARLTSFLHPWSVHCAAANCYQSDQGQIAVGSGGLFGTGLGGSLQKLFWLPEAQTDFILGVVGEELGLAGIFGLVLLYGMIAYAGLRTARRAADSYRKLLASGLTSLIVCQAVLNIGVVLGVAPLTGVPLPFISYAPTSLIVMLGAVGLLLGIARPPARELRLVDTEPRSEGSSESERRRQAKRGEGADRDRRDRGARRAGARGGRRFAG